METKRLKFKNYKKQGIPFEIEALIRFFAFRQRKMLETNYRLDFWMLIYITEGSGVHYIDYVEYPYTKGDLIVVEKNQVSSFRVNYKVSGYVIMMDEAFFMDNDSTLDKESMIFFERPNGSPIQHLEVSKNVTSRQIIDLVFREYSLEDIKNAKVIKALFIAFLYSIRSENKNLLQDFSVTSYEYYYKYRNLVEKNFSSLKTVKEYANLMGVTPKTINQACRESADLSAKQVIVNRIILEAKRYLIQGKLRSYEISDKLGFEEVANFASFFKHYTGQSAKEFKKITEEKLNNRYFL